METGITDNIIDTILLDTDINNLSNTKPDYKIRLGNLTEEKIETPDIAEKWALKNDQIKKLIRNSEIMSDIVFITCGLGGRTGTGSAPVIAKIAKQQGTLSIAVFTMPSVDEKPEIHEIAEKGLEKLRKNTNKVIVMPLDKIKEMEPNQSINERLILADQIISEAIKFIPEMLTDVHIHHIPYSHIYSMIRDLDDTTNRAEIGMIGIGESKSDNIKECIQNALNCPLLDLDISKSKRILILINTPKFTQFLQR